MKRVFVIHGFQGNPAKNWNPWLKKELEAKGVQVTIPAMPTPSRPIQSEWVKKIAEAVGKPDSDTFLVGHSLGCIAILKYLESLKKSEKVGGCVFVAGFSEEIGISEIRNFFIKAVSWTKVKTHCSKFIAIQSDDDPFVPLFHGDIFKEKLGAKLIIKKNHGHFNWRTNCLKLPIALESVLELAQTPV